MHILLRHIAAEEYAFLVDKPHEHEEGNRVVGPNNPRLSTERTLRFYDTTLESARAQMLEEPKYYADLVDGTVEGLQGRGYELVDRTLTCREEDASRGPLPEASAPQAVFDRAEDSAMLFWM